MNANEENGMEEMNKEIDSWLNWARNCRINVFVELQKIL